MTEHTKQIIETLYPMNACLLGEGYDNRLEYIKKLIDLEVIEIPSGTKFGTWTVPDEWIIRDAWIKNENTGEVLVDYKDEPLSLVIGSTPQHCIVSKKELVKNLHYSNEEPNATPYVFKYYDKDWGFCLPKNKIVERIETTEKEYLPSGEEVFKSKTKDILPDGMYEVFIDSEYKPGTMKIGVHTIKGKSDREILLFAHLDHPFQANDNLSAVACLVDLATKLKADHTIKIVFCPETIGSLAYAMTQDISKVDFVIAVDICGSSGDILMQKAFDKEAPINRVAHLAIHGIGESYRKGEFRNTIGSDEYTFNDPLIGIPGILLSTWPYNEYHTNLDTPDKIDYNSIERMQKVLTSIIDIYEKDFIPVRNFKGPLMRSKYGIETPSKQVNLSWDFFFYSIDGKKSLVELCCDFGLNFDYVYKIMLRMEENGDIKRSTATGKGKKQKTAK